MVHIILGSGGTGKTTKVTNVLADLCKKGEQKLLMLVPDQSSFETETAFLDILGPKLCRNVKVFGFSRLCNYVFTQTGNLPQNIIDDGIRSILMSMALDEVEDNLVMFNKRNTRRSVLDLMLHSLKECKKDNITTDMLIEAGERVEDETLKSKLSETALVLDAYEALSSNTYIDPLDNLNRLKELLPKSGLLDGYTIAVDSFSGFTYQQLEIIEILMKVSKDFYITLNLDYERRHSEAFATTYRTYKAVKGIARSNSITIAPKILLNDHHRFENHDLAFLEKNIFEFTDCKAEKKSDSIEMFCAQNIYSEAEYVASRIKRLVVEKGYSYKDIAVVARDHSKYSGILDTAFKKLEIPYFMDVPQDVYTRPVVRFLSCAMDYIITGYDREVLLSMMKTGLMPLTDTEISDFENYLFVWNIDGKELLKPFVNNPSGFELMTEDDKSKLSNLEKTRLFVLNPIIELAQLKKAATGKDISKALYKLITDYNIAKSINRLFDTTDEELLSDAKEEVRVYNMTIEALDKLVAVIGDKEISLKEYKQYFDFKINDLKVGNIPRFQDQVTVGTADRVRLDDTKAVFIIGAIDGEFPSIPKTAGVFTENERRILVDNKIPLTDSLEDLACHEKYLIYCLTSSPSQRLYVSTYQSDYAGNSYSPSVIIQETSRLFPYNPVLTEGDFIKYKELWSISQAFECLAGSFTDNSPQKTALKSYFETIEGYKENIKVMENLLENKPLRITDKAVCEKLFTPDMHISASQLEVYNLCAFQYFCRYGLNAKERVTASIDAMQFGNVVHYFLEQFLRSHNKAAINQLSDEDIKSSIDEILMLYAEENFGGLSDKTESFKNLYNRLKLNIFNLIKQIIRQLQYSDFTPADFELQIGKNGPIPEYTVSIDESHTVSVRGYIDRVDTMRKSDTEEYVRIVDYKTGNKEFKLYEILYGLNMQMLIYLKAIVENGQKYYNKKLIPAGILYMPSTTTAIDGDKNDSDSRITAEMDKNFRMNGLILNEGEMLTHMDRSGKLIKLPRTIKEGVYSDTLATFEQFMQIFNHIDEIIKSMGKELFDGNVSAQPVKGAKDGCAYCPYGSVCGFKQGDKYKFRDKADPKEVYEAIGKEDREDEQC